MMLDLLNKDLFPKWSDIFSVAENVLARIQESDPLFHEHLKSIAKTQPKVINEVFFTALSFS